jgi:hypothetical protein
LETEKPSDHRETQRKLCSIFSVEPEQLVDTIERFTEEVEDFEDRIRLLSDFLNKEAEINEIKSTETIEKAEKLFQVRKDREKKVEKLESQIQDFLEEEIEKNNLSEIEAEVPTENVGLLIQVTKSLSKKHQACITLIGEKGAVSASQTSQSAEEKLGKYSDNVQGSEEFAKAFDI